MLVAVAAFDLLTFFIIKSKQIRVLLYSTPDLLINPYGSFYIINFTF
jgi:hypothetical protein